MKTAAIYARVSSEQQKEENTIASQTAALVEFAREQGYSVPDEWVIEDEGFSGASLLRPGLERLRDLAAEGHIQAILIHSPDRLSRKYAYQVLLTEEFARQGVEAVFLKAPRSGAPEDQLMLQFQGMIAEYERAQILERSRRGKRHRAKAGEVSVLCGAPYGYRYIRKTSDAPARYEIDGAEAEVVRLVYDKYTVDGLSIGAIARLLREMGLPTRRRVTRWERSVVWAILRNPAYQGTACFNKTQVGQRQKVTRPFRLSGRTVHGEKSCGHERPRDEWIEIPVPAIVSEETFALAAERLADNKRFAPRRTIEPSIVQGLVSCRKCGYALSRTSTRSSARKIHYYRCLGSDAWRHLGGSVCDCRPIRQDLLDQIVWQEVVRLIEDPDTHPGRTRPAPRCGPRGRTDEAAAGSSRTRADADQEEHGALGHGLPRGSLTPRRTASPDAGTARPRTVHAGGIAGHPRSGCRPDVVPAPRRNPDRLPSAAVQVSAIAGDRRSAKDRPPPCQRSPGGR